MKKQKTRFPTMNGLALLLSLSSIPALAQSSESMINHGIEPNFVPSFDPSTIQRRPPVERVLDRVFSRTSITASWLNLDDEIVEYFERFTDPTERTAAVNRRIVSSHQAVIAPWIEKKYEESASNGTRLTREEWERLKKTSQQVYLDLGTPSVESNLDFEDELQKLMRAHAMYKDTKLARWLRDTVNEANEIEADEKNWSEKPLEESDYSASMRFLSSKLKTEDKDLRRRARDQLAHTDVLLGSLLNSFEGDDPFAITNRSLERAVDRDPELLWAIPEDLVRIDSTAELGVLEAEDAKEIIEQYYMLIDMAMSEGYSERVSADRFEQRRSSSELEYSQISEKMKRAWLIAAIRLVREKEKVASRDLRELYKRHMEADHSRLRTLQEKMERPENHFAKPVSTVENFEFSMDLVEDPFQTLFMNKVPQRKLQSEALTQPSH